MIARRQLLTGLASLLAAPAIVRAPSLMPISVYAPFDLGADDYTVESWINTKMTAEGGEWRFETTGTHAHYDILFRDPHAG